MSKLITVNVSLSTYIDDYDNSAVTEKDYTFEEGATIQTLVEAFVFPVDGDFSIEDIELEDENVVFAYDRVLLKDGDTIQAWANKS